MNLSDQIRAARGDRRREVFAGIVGCSLATVIRWEAGTTIPTDHQHVDALEREGVSREAIVAASARRVAA